MTKTYYHGGGNYDLFHNGILWITDSKEYAEDYALENSTPILFTITIDEKYLKCCSFSDYVDDPYKPSVAEIQQMIDDGYNCYELYYDEDDCYGLALLTKEPIISIKQMNLSETKLYSIIQKCINETIEGKTSISKENFNTQSMQYTKQALDKANNYLEQTNLSIEIDYDYDEWEFNSLDSEHTIGCYESGSVFEGTIEIAFNMGNLYSAYKEQVEMYPNSNPNTILKEIIYTNVFHEMGHGLIEQINDYLQETDELDVIYDNNKKMFDNALDNEEKTVEEFAWDLYDNLLDGNQLNEMVKLCLI
jgi:hypothetical protein